jgi:hypothetical protein
MSVDRVETNQSKSLDSIDSTTALLAGAVRDSEAISHKANIHGQ